MAFGRSESINDEFIEYKASLDYIRSCIVGSIQDTTITNKMIYDIIDNKTLHGTIIKMIIEELNKRKDK
jgi:hypothetical protein